MVCDPPKMRTLRVNRRGSFFEDPFFRDAWGDYNLAVRRIVDRFNHGLFTPRERLRDSQYHSMYRTLRNARQNYSSHSAKFKEEAEKYKLVMDVKEFVGGEITVRTAGKTVSVRGRVEVLSGAEEEADGVSASSGTRGLHRRFTLPSDADCEKVESNLSSDAILTVIIPKKVDIRIIPIAVEGEIPLESSSDIRGTKRPSAHEVDPEPTPRKKTLHEEIREFSVSEAECKSPYCDPSKNFQRRERSRNDGKYEDVREITIPILLPDVDQKTETRSSAKEEPKVYQIKVERESLPNEKVQILDSQRMQNRNEVDARKSKESRDVANENKENVVPNDIIEEGTDKLTNKDRQLKNRYYFGDLQSHKEVIPSFDLQDDKEVLKTCEVFEKSEDLTLNGDFITDKLGNDQCISSKGTPSVTLTPEEKSESFGENNLIKTEDSCKKDALEIRGFSPPPSPGGIEVPVKKRSSLMEDDMFKDCWNDFQSTLQDVLTRLQELSAELGQRQVFSSTKSPECDDISPLKKGLSSVQVEEKGTPASIDAHSGARSGREPTSAFESRGDNKGDCCSVGKVARRCAGSSHGKQRPLSEILCDRRPEDEKDIRVRPNSLVASCEKDAELEPILCESAWTSRNTSSELLPKVQKEKVGSPPSSGYFLSKDERSCTQNDPKILTRNGTYKTGDIAPGIADEGKCPPEEEPTIPNSFPQSHQLEGTEECTIKGPHCLRKPSPPKLCKMGVLSRQVPPKSRDYLSQSAIAKGEELRSQSIDDVVSIGDGPLSAGSRKSSTAEDTAEKWQMGGLLTRSRSPPVSCKKSTPTACRRKPLEDPPLPPYVRQRPEARRSCGFSHISSNNVRRLRDVWVSREESSLHNPGKDDSRVTTPFVKRSKERGATSPPKSVSEKEPSPRTPKKCGVDEKKEVATKDDVFCCINSKSADGRAPRRESGHPSAQVDAHQKVFRRFRDTNLRPDSEAIGFKEEEEKYKMVMDVEEYLQGEIEVLQDDKLLTVKGRVETKDERSGNKTILSFSRKFSIPGNSKEEDIDSALSKEGILTIFVPKKKERIIKIELVD